MLKHKKRYLILENSGPLNKKGKQKLTMNCIKLKWNALHGILEVLENDFLIVLFYAILKPTSIISYTLKSSTE